MQHTRIQPAAQRPGPRAQAHADEAFAQRLQAQRAVNLAVRAALTRSARAQALKILNRTNPLT